MSSRRLNITLPEQFDELLGSLALLSGRSKASYVLDALKYSLPYFQKDLRYLRNVRLVPEAAVAARDGAAAAAVGRGDSGMPEGLGRQARKRWAREHPKGRK